jgi:toxin ParE1/3/4
MPARAKLVYLPSAEQDLTDTLDWLAERSPAAAQAWLDGVHRRLGSLVPHPDLGRRPGNKRVSQLGYRVLVLGEYLAFYKARPGIVLVHRVLRGSRDLRSALH